MTVADRALRQAEALFTELGATMWVPQAAAERLRLSQHRSDSGIAATMLISRRTVENHLARIYRKLRLSGRAEFGATMAASGTQVG